MTMSGPIATLALQAIILAIMVLGRPPTATGQSYVARANGTDRFAVVLERDPSNSTLLSIELQPIGGDDCGRDFYFKGVLRADAIGQRGTVTGTMKRCTNRELKEKCPALGENYTKPVTGTFNNESYGLSLQLNYEAEKWNKDDCKFAKREHGSDVVVISSAEGRRDTSRVNRGELFRKVFWNYAGSK
jgi:hypothetical protein